MVRIVYDLESTKEFGSRAVKSSNFFSSAYFHFPSPTLLLIFFHFFLSLYISRIHTTGSDREMCLHMA